MQITAEQVARLREQTGAGMMDCKKALVEHSGDFEKAIEHLRKKGIASAAKKAGRTAKDGTVYALINNEAAVLVEVNCETDFVARNEKFQKMASDIAAHIAKANPTDSAALASQKFTSNPSKTVDEFVREAITILGENMTIRRFTRYPATANAETKSYIHMGGKVGVLVEVGMTNKTNASKEQFQAYMRDLTMHIAAANPLYLSSAEVPADVVAKEKEIALAQLASQNKPADVLEKIAIGKINKYYEETCLVKQKFVKDDKKTIEAVTNETSKAIGDTLTIKRFARYVLGEGVVDAAPETQH
ncbi:MAG: elongation factor Ts [Bdellovibrionales bacterium]|nr:elongation factor Ts [Bdellovibrionales bacterium]